LLEWIKPDEHHIATKCGTYAVSRVKTGAQLHYIAWRRPFTELASTTLTTLATDDEKLAAITAMRQACVDDVKE
jgi:deoxyxylulose-5-phosphate synthase